jgi:6-phosphogluconolactonase
MTTKESIRVLADPEDTAQAAAAFIERCLTQAKVERNWSSLMLAGGATPRRTYEVLATSRHLPWSTLHLFFGDERCVSTNDKDSNYRMANEALLSRAPIDPAHLHRMRGEDPDRERAAREYDAELPRAIDVLVLGIGPDGHTASLFPGSPALAETRRVVPVRGPKPPADRLTITPVVIASARQVVVLVTGGDKAEMVKRALRGPLDPQAVPASLLRGGTWFVDAAAAAQLDLSNR